MTEEQKKRYMCTSCGWAKPFGEEYESQFDANWAHSTWVMMLEMGCGRHPEPIEVIEVDGSSCNSASG
jgi:transposase-like protein